MRCPQCNRLIWFWRKWKNKKGMNYPNEEVTIWCSKRCYLKHIEIRRAIEKSENDSEDKRKCYKCNKKYKDDLSRFHCVYCYRYFCEEHRLPEKHECVGNPTLPQSMKYIFESWKFPKKI